jgi:hypothetical protein
MAIFRRNFLPPSSGYNYTLTVGATEHLQLLAGLHGLTLQQTVALTFSVMRASSPYCNCLAIFGYDKKDKSEVVPVLN